jgi:hypothetical protein
MTESTPSIPLQPPDARPLYQVQTATADGSGNVAITFPLVPESRAWTGTVNVVTIDGSFTGFASWQAMVRGTSIFLTWSGDQTPVNVQGINGEQLILTGQGLTGGAKVAAVWRGRDDAYGQQPFVGAWVSGAPDLVQVTNDPAFPIITQEGPVPNVVTGAVAQDAGTGPASLFVVPAGAVYKLWSVSVSGFIIAANTNASGYAEMDCWMQTITGGQVLAGIPLGMFAQAAAGQNSVVIDCKGLPLNAADGVAAHIGSLVANTHGRAYYSAVWSTS